MNIIIIAHLHYVCCTLTMQISLSNNVTIVIRRCFMSFQLKHDKVDTENKSIRFPVALIDRIEDAIAKAEGQVSFSGFVIQACEYALDNMNKEDTK